MIVHTCEISVLLQEECEEVLQVRSLRRWTVSDLFQEIECELILFTEHDNGEAHHHDQQVDVFLAVVLNDFQKVDLHLLQDADAVVLHQPLLTFIQHISRSSSNKFKFFQRNVFASSSRFLPDNFHTFLMSNCSESLL